MEPGAALLHQLPFKLRAQKAAAWRSLSLNMSQDALLTGCWSP